MKRNQETFNTKKQKVSEKQIKEYVIERFEDVKNRNKIKNLVLFQAMNKYMIMSHDQNELKILGNIVASHKRIQFSEILIEYEKHLKKSFEKEPTIKTHSNVMMHVFGYFSKNFTQLEKEQFFELLKQFQEEKITIGNILSKINPIIFKFNNTYLASQTYFLLYSESNQNNLFDVLMKK